MADVLFTTTCPAKCGMEPLDLPLAWIFSKLKLLTYVSSYVPMILCGEWDVGST
jgi:hypothetical protein